jgi:hypothetical protein
MQLELNILNVSFGKVPDGPQWAKVTATEDVIEENSGFSGLKVHRLPVVTENIDTVINKLKGKLPGNFKASCGIKVKSGDTLLTLLDIVVDKPTNTNGPGLSSSTNTKPST